MLFIHVVTPAGRHRLLLLLEGFGFRCCGLDILYGVETFADETHFGPFAVMERLKTGPSAFVTCIPVPPRSLREPQLDEENPAQLHPWVGPLMKLWPRS